MIPAETFELLIKIIEEIKAYQHACMHAREAEKYKEGGRSPICPSN